MDVERQRKIKIEDSLIGVLITTDKKEVIEVGWIR